MEKCLDAKIISAHRQLAAVAYAARLSKAAEIRAADEKARAARLRSLLRFGCVEAAHAAGAAGFLRGGSNIHRDEREHLSRIGARLGATMIR